eukprot:GHVU01204251.1.p1 GENE.GHVU01204251.1~~GHVU01204251.1.p1  ORF type:complete len:282 (+),score=49.39 GHVU01204251.1:373-1218(+)
MYKDKECSRFESSSLAKKLFRRNAKECLYWCTFLGLVLAGYKFFSDGSFSAVLTLSSAFQCFAFLLLLVKMRTQRSSAGVSRRSLLLCMTSLVFRLFSTLWHNGYLPVDRSGDWIYQVADLLSVGIIGLIVFLISRKYRATYQAQQDSFTLLVPFLLAAVLPIIARPDLNNYLPADYAWTMALYLETFSMIPQLFMMGKIGGEVEALTSNYVASLAASKFFSFIFWLFSYKELAPRAGHNIAGWAVVGAYTTQLLLFADFLYHYVVSLRLGKAMIIPAFGV